MPIEIPEDIKLDAQENFDYFIEELGVECLLFYPGIWEECPNCFIDNAGNKSSNRYRTGGPVPFNVGLCPLCGGSARRTSEVSEAIKATVDLQPKAYTQYGPPTRMPDGIVEIRTYMTNYPKLVKAEYIIIQTDVQPYSKYRYKVDSEPVDRFMIVPNRYCYCYLKRVV